MFKLKPSVPDVITSDEVKKCQILFDCLLGNEEKFLKEQHLSGQTDKKHPMLIEQMFTDRNQITQDNKMLISALRVLIQQVNSHWTVENKAKLIKAIITTGSEQLVTFLPNETSVRKEDQKLACSFSDYIKKRENASQAHKKLKASIS